MGWQLFIHSVRLVFTNLDAAFRVSLVLYAIYSGIGVWMSVRYGSELLKFQYGQLPDPSVWGVGLIVLVIDVILFSWIAIAWHRFVLLGERPAGWIPAWPGGPILGYIGRSILIALLIIVVAIPVGIVLNILAMVLGPLLGTAVAGLGIILVMAVVFYRVASILPAGALGKPISMGTAWAATRGQGGSIILMAVLIAVVSYIFQLPSMFNPDPTSILNQVYVIVVRWFSMLIGVSILTTIYGVFVEKRAL